MAKYDQDPNPDPHWFCAWNPDLHWGKKLDPDRHWYQCGFATLDLSCFFTTQGLHTWNTRWPTGPTSTCRPPGASPRIRVCSTESSTLSNTGKHRCLWARNYMFLLPRLVWQLSNNNAKISIFKTFSHYLNFFSLSCCVLIPFSYNRCCGSWIPDPGSKRFRIPDPLQLQRI